MTGTGRIVPYVVSRIMLRALRKAFRRVCWVGERPVLPPRCPVVLYANHHSFYDGYLLWLLVTRLLERPATLWMADWDRFPLFAAVGAQPFPAEDPARRAATVRRTARRFRQTPDTVMIYFPEGRLHAPGEGISPFDPATFARLDRVLPEKVWWPVAIHVTWGVEPSPTALLTGGVASLRARGDERDQLTTLWQSLQAGRSEPRTPLLEGAPGADERWNFSFARRLFDRFLMNFDRQDGT